MISTKKYDYYTFDSLKRQLTLLGTLQAVLLQEENSQQNNQYDSQNIIRFITKENKLTINNLIQVNNSYYRITSFTFHNDIFTNGNRSYYEMTGEYYKIESDTNV